MGIAKMERSGRSSRWGPSRSESELCPHFLVHLIHIPLTGRDERTGMIPSLVGKQNHHPSWISSQENSDLGLKGLSTSKSLIRPNLHPMRRRALSFKELL